MTDNSEELHQVKTNLAVLTAQVSLWMVNTETWRTEQRNSLHGIYDKLELLPCKERAGNYKQLKYIWGLLMLIIVALIGGWIWKH